MKRVKFYAIKILRILSLIFIPIFLISLIILLKYDPVYMVKFRGETLGIVSSKEEIENEIKKLETPVAPEKTAELKEKPNYELILASKSKIKTEEGKVKTNLEKAVQKTYRIYDITIEGKTVASTKFKEEANEIVEKVQKEEKYSDIKISEKITKDITTKTAQEAEQTVVAKVKEIKKAEEEKKAIARAKARRAQSYYGYLSSSVGAATDKEIRALGLIRPTDTTLCTTYYGDGPAQGYYYYRRHSGVDLASGIGSHIYAAGDGRVVGKGYSTTGYGNFIKVDHGNGISTFYAHLNGFNVSLGDYVSKGQVIGYMGSTGNSSGSHLHYEIRVNNNHINPHPYIPGRLINGRQY